MKSFFNAVINTLIRNVSYPVRLAIAFGLMFLAILSLIWSIRRKNDAHPIAWGWMILFVISASLSVIYIVL